MKGFDLHIAYGIFIVVFLILSVSWINNLSCKNPLYIICTFLDAFRIGLFRTRRIKMLIKRLEKQRAQIKKFEKKLEQYDVVVDYEKLIEKCQIEFNRYIASYEKEILLLHTKYKAEKERLEKLSTEFIHYEYILTFGNE